MFVFPLVLAFLVNKQTRFVQYLDSDKIPVRMWQFTSNPMTTCGVNVLLAFFGLDFPPCSNGCSKHYCRACFCWINRIQANIEYSRNTRLRRDFPRPPGGRRPRRPFGAAFGGGERNEENKYLGRLRRPIVLKTFAGSWGFRICA